MLHQNRLAVAMQSVTYIHARVISNLSVHSEQLHRSVEGIKTGCGKEWGAGSHHHGWYHHPK